MLSPKISISKISDLWRFSMGEDSEAILGMRVPHLQAVIAFSSADADRTCLSWVQSIEANPVICVFCTGRALVEIESQTSSHSEKQIATDGNLSRVDFAEEV